MAPRPSESTCRPLLKAGLTSATSLLSFAIPRHAPRGIMDAGTPSRFPAEGIKIIVTETRQHFFFEHYDLTNQDLEKYLAAALSAGGDYADLYFEYLTSTSLMVDESMVKSASQGISAGCGVRVIA